MPGCGVRLPSVSDLKQKLCNFLVSCPHIGPSALLTTAQRFLGRGYLHRLQRVGGFSARFGAGELSVGEDPAPIRFHSVSMSRQSVALQYAKQLLSDDSAEALDALWDKREALRCHSLEAFRMNIGDTPEERLRVWLDNYNERGSFDDRTLVVIKINDD